MHRRRGPERSAALFVSTFTRTDKRRMGIHRRPDLRHHAARRRAGPRQQPDPRGEAPTRPAARRARRGHHRGGLPGRVGGRLPERARDRRPRSGGRSSPRWRGAPSGDIDLAGEALGAAARGPDPRLHLDLRPAHPGEAADSRATRCWSGPGPRSAARGSTPTTSSSPPRTPAAPTPTSSAGWSRRPSRRGPTTINLPDTVGYAMPAEYGAMFRDVLARVPGADRVILSAHCHDDLGLAVANSLAAIAAGRAAGGVHGERHRRAGRATRRWRRS